MNNNAVHTRRKIIDIREDVYRFLSIKAAASGTNLKNYIESLLEKEVDKAFAQLKKDGAIVSPVRCKWQPAE